jgi:hypothetical protein
MKMYILSDGWPAYLHADGSLTDTPNKTGSDLGWDSLDQIKQWDEDVREATLAERKEYARIRHNHRVWIGEV